MPRPEAAWAALLDAEAPGDPDEHHPKGDGGKTDCAAGLGRDVPDRVEEVLKAVGGQCEHQPLDHEDKPDPQKENAHQLPWATPVADALPPAPSRNSKNSLSGVITIVEFEPWSARS